MKLVLSLEINDEAVTETVEADAITVKHDQEGLVVHNQDAQCVSFFTWERVVSYWLDYNDDKVIQ